MRPIPPLVLFGLMYGPIQARTLERYVGQARPIVLFAQDAADPRLTLQLEWLRAAQGQLLERDCVVILDTDPGSALRARFAPTDFTLIAVCKAGTEELRSTEPVPADTLTALIDAWPMRQREMQGG